MDKTYVAVTVTLAAANTRYNLLDLIRAIEPTCPATAREFTLQAPRGNAAAVIGVGDAAISAVRRAYNLESLDSRTYRSNLQNIGLGNKYLWSDTPGVTLNVEVEVA